MTEYFNKIKKNTLLFKLLFGICLFFNIFPPSYALTVQELKIQISNIEKDIANIANDKKVLNQEITKSQAEKGEVSNEINNYQFNIRKNELEVADLKLKIQENEKSSEVLVIEIDSINNEIINKSLMYNNLKESVKNRLSDIYVNNVILTNSKSKNDSRENYVKRYFQNVIRVEDDQKADNAYKLRTELNEKEKELNIKKEDLSNHKKELIDKQVNLKSSISYLESQKQNKQSYINYIEMQLGQKKIEVNSLSQKSIELSSRISEVQKKIFELSKPISTGIVKKVKRGDYIGYQGDTGWSTGPHLHFFVSYNGGYALDPCKYLKSGIVAECSGNGSLSWPMISDVNWSRGFFNGHPAIDIYKFNNAEIYAAHDGYAYKGKETCQSWYPICKAGGANYVIICESENCLTGWKTGYWHLIE